MGAIKGARPGEAGQGSGQCRRWATRVSVQPGRRCRRTGRGCPGGGLAQGQQHGPSLRLPRHHWRMCQSAQRAVVEGRMRGRFRAWTRRTGRRTRLLRAAQHRQVRRQGLSPRRNSQQRRPHGQRHHHQQGDAGKPTLVATQGDHVQMLTAVVLPAFHDAVLSAALVRLRCDRLPRTCFSWG
jgi:hypothetical protein